MQNKMDSKAKALAMEHYDLIAYFAKKHHVSYDEWHGLLSCALCNAAMKYKENGSASFRTFAYRCLKNAYINEMRKTKAVDISVFSSYDTEENEGQDVLTAVRPDIFSISEEETYAEVVIDDTAKFIENLVKDTIYVIDADIFLRHAAGETIKDIAGRYGKSTEVCSNIIRSVRATLAADQSLLELRGKIG